MSTPNLEQQANESIATYPAPETLKYMEHQATLFEEIREELLSQYLGKYVLFENGKVLDADDDHERLVLRTYEKTGLRPLFVRRVLQSDPQPQVRTPFLN